MYQITASNEGFKFSIPNGNIYFLYLTQQPIFGGSDYKFTSNLKTDNFYYLGFDPISLVNNDNSYFTKRAIASIIFSFFTENIDSVIVFNYSTKDGKIKARRRLFKKWIDYYCERSLVQFYQHDYTDEFSVCALYYRTGGDKFHLLKSDVEGFLSAIGNYLTEK